MTKIVTRTDDVAGFFSRATEAAGRADRGEAFESRVTLSFEDPQLMFTVFSQTRRRYSWSLPGVPSRQAVMDKSVTGLRS